MLLQTVCGFHSSPSFFSYLNPVLTFLNKINYCFYWFLCIQVNNMVWISCISLSYSLIFHSGFVSLSDLCSYSFETTMSAIFQKLYFQLIITIKWSYPCLCCAVLRNLYKSLGKCLVHIGLSSSSHVFPQKYRNDVKY